MKITTADIRLLPFATDQLLQFYKTQMPFPQNVSQILRISLSYFFFSKRCYIVMLTKESLRLIKKIYFSCCGKVKRSPVIFRGNKAILSYWRNRGFTIFKKRKIHLRVQSHLIFSKIKASLNLFNKVVYKMIECGCTDVFSLLETIQVCTKSYTTT